MAVGIYGPTGRLIFTVAERVHLSREKRAKVGRKAARAAAVKALGMKWHEAWKLGYRCKAVH